MELIWWSRLAYLSNELCREIALNGDQWFIKRTEPWIKSRPGDILVLEEYWNKAVQNSLQDNLVRLTHERTESESI
jgi:hypothetical protein